MKKSFLFGFVSIITSSFLAVSSVFGAEVTNFKVELAPQSSKVGESLDLTITALDKNGAVVNDYVGTVLIYSETDKEASLPIVLQDSTYTFKDIDQGTIKFENGVKFTKAGTHSIEVIDTESEGIGKAEVEISDSLKTESADIEILSPENGITLGENRIKVSGTTLKNSKVNIVLNGTGKNEVISNGNGVFEKDLENLLNGENIIYAEILNSDNQVLGKTSEIKIKIEGNGLAIKGIKLTPEKVFVEGPYEIEIIAVSGLKEVTAVINDSVIKLKEEDTGVYKGNSFAPKKSGIYKVDVNLLNDLGHKLNELGVATLKVNELNAPLKEEKGEIKKEEVVVEKNRNPLKITGLKLVQLKTKSVLTWDKLENVKSYNVYKKDSKGELEFVKKVDEPKLEIDIEGKKIKFEDFYIRANGEDEDGVYEGVLSDPTKIQTGPELLIILLVSLFFAGMFLIFKGRKKSS